MSIASTKFAALAPRFSGGTSAVSSSTIIFLIFRSKTKLKSTYHRIMFGMSFFDVLSSVAIGLSTLPMPIDLPFPHPPYDGTRLGNVQTCEAQGFMFILGFIAVFAYNAVLFIYYTCSIAFQIKEEKISKFIEPILHLIPMSVGLGVAIPPLVHGLYNPTTWDAWCSIAANAERGKVQADETWLRIKMQNIDTLVMYLCIALILIISASIILILWRVIKVGRALKNPTIKRLSARIEEASRSHDNTKVVVKQVMAYLLSFAISLGILLVRSIIVEPYWVIYLSFVLMPLQGFFNALIFISHKVYNYRRVHGDVSRCDVIKLLFRGNADEPLLLSRISLVRMNDDARRDDLELLNGNDDNNQVLHVDKDGFVSASQSGGEVWIDEESKKDLDGFSAFSAVEEANSARVASNNNNSRRERLNSSVTELPSSQEREDLSLGSPRSSRNLSPSLGAEDGISVAESNSASILSRFMWMSRAENRTSLSVGLSLEPSVENEASI